MKFHKENEMYQQVNSSTFIQQSPQVDRRKRVASGLWVLIQGGGDIVEGVAAAVVTAEISAREVLLDPTHWHQTDGVSGGEYLQDNS